MYMNTLNIKYWGHACFSVEYRDYTVVFDPYAPDSVPGLRPLALTANAVFCSHAHSDHSWIQAVRTTGGSSPFTVDTISCPHDDTGGSKRGMNTIHILRCPDFALAHMGDIGCPLPTEALEKLRGLDVLFIPIGGYYTINTGQANNLADRIGSRIVIPMHYRTAASGYDVTETVDRFAALRSYVCYRESALSLPPVPAPCTVILQQAMLPR